MIRRFISYYKPHKKLFFLDLVCSFTIALCNLFYPFVTKQVINDYAPNKVLDLMLIWCAALLGIYIVKAILSYIVQYWGHVLGVRIQGDMREDFFRHIETLPFTFFDDNKTGAVMSRITNDLFDVSELAHHGPEDTFTSVITVIGSVILLCLTVNPWLALIILVIIPFMLLFAIKARQNMRIAFKKSREGMAEVNAEVESSISGIRVAKAYNASQNEIDKFHKSNMEYMKARSSSYKAMGVFFSGMGFFNDFLYLVAITAGGLFFYYDLIDVGELAAYILYTTMMINPIRTLVNIFEQIQNGMTGFVRFAEIMDIPGEEESANPVPVGELKGDIKYESVTFSYKNKDNKNTVIKDFSLNVPAGKTVALVGPSGGGKTTLCHLLPRFYEIEGGRITIDGVDIRDMRRSDLRRNVGIVAQDVFLFGGSIRDNIEYGKPGATDAEIIEAAKKANIHEFISSLPDGYDTYVGERGVKLSGGQKQRISIARAFLKNPPILVLDEATSALDNITELQIQNSLNTLSKGRTTLVVAHRLSTIKNADEIIVLDKDGIIERGTHDQLVELKGEYFKLSGAVAN
ncbi:MAG: ABC transporter ATP-binding protein [Clostridiales bacterium]|nr:ABC transporter ATP-binding protein [Clostridiales bacterium]